MTTITSLIAIPFRERFAFRDAWNALNYSSLGWGYALGPHSGDHRVPAVRQCSQGRDLQVAVPEFCACAPCLLREIAPQSVRLVCRWDDGDKQSIYRTGRHTKLWHVRESSNRGRSMGSYSPYCVEEKFCELRVDGVLGSSA